VGFSPPQVIHIFLPVVFEGKYPTIDLVVFRNYLLLDDIKAVMSHGRNSTAFVRIITGQFSKSGTRTPLREYYVWWSQETLSVSTDKTKRRIIEIVHFRFILTFTLSLVG
jgi:hypothetical protein